MAAREPGNVQHPPQSPRQAGKDESPRQAGQDEGESGLKGRIAQVKKLRPVRAFTRYGKARGGLLAGGIAYSALFSLAAALTIAWTVFMATVGRNPGLRTDVIGAVNQVLPGVLKDGPAGAGMVDPDQLVLDSAVTPASIVAALVLLWTAVSMMTNIRVSIQDMFGIVAPTENMALQKLRDLGGFIAMSLGIVLSAVLGTAAGTMGRTVLGAIGLGDNPVASVFVRIGGLLVAAAVAMATFVFLFRVTAAVRPPRKDLLLGSAVGGIAVQIVLTLGTSLVASTQDNPLLAASASLVTLLLFVNLLSRVLLLVAAFTANPPEPVMPESGQEVHFDETPNYVTLSAPHTLDWAFQDITGQVEADPSLRPGAPAEPPAGDVRPDGRPIPREDLGRWAARRVERQARKLETRAVEARARLGQRPRMEEAEREYWAEHGNRDARR